jgi:uncharacterized protein (UPF0333 family)
MIFIYEYLIFGGVLAVIVLAYVVTLIHYTRRQINSASSSSTESLLSSAVEV